MSTIWPKPLNSYVGIAPVLRQFRSGGTFDNFLGVKQFFNPYSLYLNDAEII